MHGAHVAEDISVHMSTWTHIPRVCSLGVAQSLKLEVLMPTGAGCKGRCCSRALLYKS